MPVQKIKSFVLGGHGDSMVAMESTEVNGKKINDLVKEGKLKKEKLDQIVDRTKKGGAEIVKYLEKGSAFLRSSCLWNRDGRKLFKRSKKTIALCSIS